MKHNFYINCNRNCKPSGNRINMDYSRQPPRHNANSLEILNPKLKILDNLAKAVLEKYNDIPEIRDEINNTLEVFRINYTIAKELNCSKSQKELVVSIKNYLNNLLKKEK